MRDPVLHPRMRRRAMRAVVVAQQVVEEPGIGLGFGLRFMEVIQRLVRLFHRAEWPLHFAFRAGRGAAAIVATGQMCLHLDAQIVHHLVKHVTARHWTVIRIMWPFVLCGSSTLSSS